MYEIFFKVWRHMTLDPLPMSQTVTSSRTLSPLERDVLYGRPRNACLSIMSIILMHEHSLVRQWDKEQFIINYVARRLATQ